MSINSKRVGDSVVRKLRGIGIDDKVGNTESHTAILVRIIIDEVMKEIINNGVVMITDATAQTAMGPAKVIGKAKII